MRNLLLTVTHAHRIHHVHPRMAYGSTDSLEILAQDFLERKCSRTFADQNHSLEISTATATPVLPVAGLRVWNVTSCFPQTPMKTSLRTLLYPSLIIHAVPAQ